MSILKKIWADALIITLFIVISIAYFTPAVFEGRILYQHDSSAGKGLGHELTEYHEKTGEYTRWTNSSFSGMPTYQIAPSYKSTDILSNMVKAYHLWLPEYVWFLFAYLLGFYILLRSFDFRRALSALGSVFWAFSTYFLIIIAAGHYWKVMALAYLPPMIAGIILAYRGKYIRGLIVTAIFSAFEVFANHVQMSYYFLFVILFLVIGFFVQALQNKTLPHFFKATAVCAVGAIIGICINISNLYHTWEYSKESMRGKSEIQKPDDAKQTDSGLDRDYITQWSYGIGETWTLLVPNAKGGASVPLSENKITQEKADPQYAQIFQQIGQYWGDQPGTSGPVYVGALVLMLFIFSLFVVKGPIKWALLAATILSILLAWGKNFMPFTDFFIDHIPMYSKFRTVASILVIAEFTIPLLAVMGLHKIITQPETLQKESRYFYLSFALTGGFCLIFALVPTLFFSKYISAGEMQAIAQWPEEYKAPFIQNLQSIRQAIFTADAWRSFIIIMIGSALILLFKSKKIKTIYFLVGIAVLCTGDLWQINKRYLNDKMFVDNLQREMPQKLTMADQMILKDKTDLENYRVLNLASDAFNENQTSYYHKSIGGYHPAKLRRYQEIIERYIYPEMQQLTSQLVKHECDMTQIAGDSIHPVINMLNTRYFILPVSHEKSIPVRNTYALGTAWFVDKINYVDNANQEIDAIDKMDLRHQAVADKRFKEALQQSESQDNDSKVVIKDYAPNRLKYEVQSRNGGVIVFSEIYYPEWTATIDGQETPLGRVNYILRAIHVKPGKHEICLTFDPVSVRWTDGIAYGAYGICILLILISIGVSYRRNSSCKQNHAHEV